MRASTRRLVVTLAVGAVALVACGGGDDDSTDLGDAAVDANDVSGDASSSDADDGSADDGSAEDDSSPSGAGFGEFISGEITVAGDEELTYSVDDPAFDYVGGGGCGFGPGIFGFTLQAREADTGFTAMQLAAEIDADLSGGATGSYPVEQLALVTVSDGDLAASRSYEGPATMVVSEHDAGGATSDPNTRRMVISFDGALVGSPSDGGGEVEVSADLVWVMGCP